MRIDVLSLFPEMVHSVAEYGVTGRAVKSGRLRLVTWNPRDFATDSHRTVDDRPYGGGPGMVMKVQPLRDALARAHQAGALRAIYLSPQGATLDQARAKQLAASPGFTLVAGRYEGVDQRFVDEYIDEELSIGDYVLSGGELAAMVVIDAVARLLPGTLGDKTSAAQDSFFDGLLDHPHYTRPEEIGGQRVPDVLLSGDHSAIAAWRRQQALGRTWLKRRDLLTVLRLDPEDQQLLEGYIASHRRAPKHRQH